MHRAVVAPQPLYQRRDVKLAGPLRFTWSGWPSGKRLLPAIDPAMLEAIKPLWETDGMRLLEHRWSPREVQLAFSTNHDVAPALLAARAKGRLQYALRKAGVVFDGFVRMVAVRSVGENTRPQVEQYVLDQVANEGFVDPRFREQMEEFTVRCPDVDLSQPIASARGRYWYNLHLVLVVVERSRIVDRKRLATIRDGCFRIAAKKGCEISVLAVMPDHVHMATRVHFEMTPREVGLAFQNNLAYMLGQVPFWQESFYTGTFSEYDMGAIRARATASHAKCATPSGLPDGEKD